MKKLLPYFAGVLLLIFCCSCGEAEREIDVVKDSTRNTNKISAEDINFALDTLMKLPEVKQVERKILAATNGKNGVTFLQSQPADNNRLGFDAGYNGKDRFETRLSFEINPGTRQIWVNDTDSGLVTLDNYRSIHKRPRQF
ncbi:MAG TPA: hypothetical protein VG738_11450 [Chitinophagaceae bacterium]|nr:hypothetical protein [Chitinophagaceae bacterium]